ncbi:MAG: histidine--tRNA ligase [Oscillospiraceae bacterium]|nr:histidine--tRNA ligase [Oscillospiraceae bacterium]
MAVIVQRPKGTQDAVPSTINKWHTVEAVVRDSADQFGFKEIRTPVFEDTSLFVRSVGDTSDVVTKEMYTVSSKGDATFTLRPEGTAGAVRAMLENGVMNEGFPQKIYYIASCYRHEKPQAGRLREFHQFGVEMFGSASPYADAEVIMLAKHILNQCIGDKISLNINSIGCPECRANYHKALKEYFEAKKADLCGTCLERLDKNPMRILDCKSPVCSEIAKDAPKILDYLCDDCSAHFEKLKEILDAHEIAYTVNPKIVRGLDYYTRTVFEFISTDIGAQGTVCGGGRYDGLVSQLGGQPTPALGFGMGLERLILVMEKLGIKFMDPVTPDIYIAPMGDKAQLFASKLAAELRDAGYKADYDIVGRGLKPQMRYADKVGAKFVVVLGDNELETGDVKIKNMRTGEQTDAKLDGFVKSLEELYVNEICETDNPFSRAVIEALGGEK